MLLIGVEYMLFVSVLDVLVDATIARYGRF